MELSQKIDEIDVIPLTDRKGHPTGQYHVTIEVSPEDALSQLSPEELTRYVLGDRDTKDELLATLTVDDIAETIGHFNDDTGKWEHLIKPILNAAINGKEPKL